MDARRRKVYRIGFLYSRSTKSARDRFSGILRYAASRADWEVRVVNPPDHPYAADANEVGAAERLDGLIGGRDGFAHRRASGRRRLPFVSLDAAEDDAPTASAAVSIDNAAIARAGADVLIRGGLRNLAFVGIRSDAEATHQAQRIAAFRARAAEADVACAAFAPPPGEDWARTIERLAAWLRERPAPCGVMAYNDGCAQTVLDACRMAHLRVPDQIQIVGVDNETEICENLQPTLTSVLPDFEGGGFLAARLLDDILTHGRGRAPRRLTYGVKTVVVRASTQDMKGGGRLVTLAREYIRLHAGENIDSQDVAAHLNVSRCTLATRFREVLGRGVGEVLREERLARVRRLLVETDRPVSAIAYESGFASPTYLMGLFKKRFGLTMGALRARRAAYAILSDL